MKRRIIGVGRAWRERCCGVLLGAALGCGAPAEGGAWGDDESPAGSADVQGAEADALLERFVLPGQTRVERLALVDEIEALPPELSRRFQYRLLDHMEARSTWDEGSWRAMRRALTEVGVDNELFGLSLPAPLIEEAMWRAFAPRSDALGAERVEDLVASYTSALSEISPRARRDRGLPPFREPDPEH